MMPFIDRNCPLARPSVRSNRPSIGFGKIFGFTLIELITTLTVLAILVGIAVPSMRSFLLDGRIRSQTDDLAGALNLARSEAIKLQAPVSVCIPNGSKCDGTNWAGAWVVWFDKNGDTNVDTEEKLRSMGLPQSDISISETSSASSVQFGANGNTVSGTAFTFWICDNVRAGETGRQIGVNVTGRVAVTTFTCS